MAYGGVQSKVFTFDVASDTWTVNHNMGLIPVADVRASVDGEITKVYPLSMVYPDVNTIVIQWSVPRTGSVLLATAQV
jgi:hypothetical protein